MSRFVTIDVECVATGIGHNDRRPASVAVVAEDGEVLLDCKIFQETLPLDYLFPFSGLTESDFADAIAFDEVLETVRGLLGPGTIIVGQSVINDINWLRLEKGRDFDDIFDLADVFMNEGPGDKKYFYSLDYTCHILLGAKPPGHSAAGDAVRTMKLFNDHCRSQKTINKGKKQLNLAWNRGIRPPQRPLEINGICMSKYNPLKCICGQPTGKSS